MEKKFRKYLHGNCNPVEFEEVIQELCSVEQEGKIASALSEHWHAVLKEEVTPKNNEQLLDKIHHRIALDESARSEKRILLYRNLLKVAAIFIGGLLATSLFYFNRAEKTRHDESLIMQSVTAPFGAKSHFKLPDGSEVWLNSGSTISYPRQYSDVRGVELNGQAYFAVMKDKKPFVVSTKYGKVEVMGTSFDVKAYEQDQLTTTLVEGSVRVRNANNQYVVMKPGQQSVILADQKFLMKEVDTNMYTSWKDGKLVFVNEPFSRVAIQLERWYNVKIELQGDKLKNLGYTGTIEMETFSEVLELINTTTPISYSFNKNTRILKIAGR